MWRNPPSNGEVYMEEIQREARSPWNVWSPTFMELVSVWSSRKRGDSSCWTHLLVPLGNRVCAVTTHHRLANIMNLPVKNKKPYLLKSYTTTGKSRAMKVEYLMDSCFLKGTRVYEDHQLTCRYISMHFDRQSWRGSPPYWRLTGMHDK